jgi:hypothetical protein
MVDSTQVAVQQRSSAFDRDGLPKANLRTRSTEQEALNGQKHRRHEDLTDFERRLLELERIALQPFKHPQLAYRPNRPLSGQALGLWIAGVLYQCDRLRMTSADVLAHLERISAELGDSEAMKATGHRQKAVAVKPARRRAPAPVDRPAATAPQQPLACTALLVIPQQVDLPAVIAPAPAVLCLPAPAASAPQPVDGPAARLGIRPFAAPPMEVPQYRKVPQRADVSTLRDILLADDAPPASTAPASDNTEEKKPRVRTIVVRGECVEISRKTSAELTPQLALWLVKKAGLNGGVVIDRHTSKGFAVIGQQALAVAV